MFREIYKFLASLKLAILLLVVIIVASIRGTMLESNFNAEVAKHYIYNAIWFNAWLVMLCVNLFCVASIRYPWKPHQTGFVITHAGIITLLMGGMIDRQWGIEGNVNLYRGSPHTDLMSLHEQRILVYGSGVEKPEQTDLIVKAMVTPEDKNFAVKSPFADVKIEVLDVDAVEAYEYAAAAESGAPALQLTLQGPQMGRHEMPLSLDEEKNLADMIRLQFMRGMPPPPKPKPDAQMMARLERGFVFAKHDGVMGSTPVGEPTGMEAKLFVDSDGRNPVLDIKLYAKPFKIPVMENLKKPFVLPELDGWTLHLLNYYPNFKMGPNGPMSLNENPDNPSVLFELSGPLVKVDPAAIEVKAGSSADANGLTIYLGDDSKLRYLAKTRRAGESRGEIELNKAVAVPWAPGTEFVATSFFSKAAMKAGWRKIDRTKLPPGMKENLNIGLLVKVSCGSDSKETWMGQVNPEGIVKGGRRNDLLAIEVGGKKVELGFAHKTVRLPFKVGLFHFDPKYQEGMEFTTSFFAFESTLSFLDNPSEKNKNPQPLRDVVRIKPGSILIDALGRDLQISPGVFEGAIIEESEKTITFVYPLPQSAEPVIIPRDELLSYEKNTHEISMNYPTTYPSTWYGPWLGTSYKFSQAGHDMRSEMRNGKMVLVGNPHYSGVQVLRDPGWAPKWIGCLMICFGIFTMFYLKPYFNRPKK